LTSTHQGGEGQIKRIEKATPFGREGMGKKNAGLKVGWGEREKLPGWYLNYDT
jgi:hypothetical protein